MMVVMRELLWLLLVTIMATGTQQQQQSPGFPSSSPPPSPSAPPPLPPSPPLPPPADDLRRSSGESGDEGQLSMMMTLPSEDEGLILATGDTAILECRISTAVAAAGAGCNKNLSWTNTLTNTKMTTNNTAFQNTSLTYQTSVDSNETSLILTISNLTAAKSEFRCELDTDQNGPIHRTVKVTVFSSDWFCTFEGETTCAWKIGNAWTREHSSSETNEPASCGSGFPDHTYGKNNANGHFLIARVTGDQQIEGATLNTTVRRNITECIRFYYRTCVTNDSREGVQLMLTTKPGISSPPLLINLSLALDWTEHSLILPPQNQEHEIIMSFTYANASDFAYIAIDDIRMEDDNCDSSANQQAIKMESTSESRSLLQAPTSTITTNAALTTTSSSQSSTSKTASTSQISSSTTTTATQPTSSFAPTTPTTTTTAPTKASSSSLPPTAMNQPTVVLPLLTSLLSSTAARRAPDEGEDSIRPTDDDRSSPAVAVVDEAEEDEANDDAGAAAAATGDNSTGLAIGIILAIMVAGACTAAILYRRRKNGKKSTYITFGNPSYSREHLPVNDFGLDSPLTLSSNGYTVLA